MLFSVVISPADYHLIFNRPDNAVGRCMLGGHQTKDSTRAAGKAETLGQCFL